MKLRFSHAQRCHALKCGSRFHCLVHNLRLQSRRIFAKTGSPAKSQSTKTDVVNVFLSSQSYCSSGLPDHIPGCTHQWNKVEFSRVIHSPSGPKVCCFCNVLSWTKLGKCTQICIVVHILSSELGSCFRLTPTCFVISLVVYSLSWSSRCIQIL